MSGGLAEFCARLQAFRAQAGNPTLEWLARQSGCPGKSQLSKIFRGEIERVPDHDVISGIIRACAHHAQQRGRKLTIPADEQLWETERAVLERMQERGSTQQPPQGAIPAQLPADVTAFTGRAHELSALDEFAVADPSAVIISAVSGTAGVGKTALAIRWAHRVKHKFPDGQLYVNLRGYDPDKPRSPGSALAGFLRGLGLSGEEIPLDTDERAATFRSLVDGKRVLIVLDNAADVEQVRPLLPGTSSCLVLVTSRDSLSGLVAGNGAHRVDLDLLADDEAMDLLRTLVTERVDAEPEAAALLAKRCAHLPLALRIAAEYAASRPDTQLSQVTAELGDEQLRQDLFDSNDPRTALWAVFSWSYRDLPAEAATLFRLAGLHPGADFDSYAAAALAGVEPAAARRSLDTLARAHLLEPNGHDRYYMHDLLRAYAGYLIEDHDQVQDALTRLFDHYLATAAMAIDILRPAEHEAQPPIQQTLDALVKPIANGTDAQQWLSREMNNLFEIYSHSFTGRSDYLSTAVLRYVAERQDVGTSTIHEHALQAARQTGNRTAEAQALIYLGNQLLRQGEHRAAFQRLHLALNVAREAADRITEAYALGDLGVVYRSRGNYDSAADLLGQGLAIAAELDNPSAQALMLTDLGLVRHRQGQNQEAKRLHRQAREMGHDSGNQPAEAYALSRLGLMYAGEGDYWQAFDLHSRAMRIVGDAGNRYLETEVRNNLGESLLASGNVDVAELEHQQAQAKAIEVADAYQLARAHRGLGDVHEFRGDDEAARHEWQTAATIFRQIEAPEGREWFWSP